MISKCPIAVLLFLILIQIHSTFTQTLDDLDASALADVYKYLRMADVVVLCNFTNSKSKMGFHKMLLRDRRKTILPIEDVARNGMKFLDNSVALCWDELDLEERSRFYSQSGQFEASVRRPWLIIHSDPIETFEDFDISINRQLFFLDLKSKELAEFYKVGNRTMMNLLGEIIDDEFFLLHKQGEYLRRRSDFKGLNLVVLVEDQQPFIFFKNYTIPEKASPEQEIYEIGSLNVTSGMFFDLLNLLGHEMNFTTTLMRRFDGVWGLKKDGEWNGMVKDLEYETVDMIGTSLTLNSGRHEVVNFLFPLGKETYAIYIKNPDQEAVDWNIYQYPFSVELWGFLFCAVFVLALCIRLVESAYRYKTEKQWSLSENLTNFVPDMWLVYSSYLGGKPRDPPGRKKWPSRFLIFSILLVGNFVFMSYRASITSELSVWSIKMPFNDLQGLLQSDYRIITSEGGLLQSFFTEAQEGNILRDLYLKSMKPYEDEAYFSNIKDGMHQAHYEHRLALFYNQEGVRNFQSYNCKLVNAWITEYPGLLSFAVPKSSPYYSFMMHSLLELSENGALGVVRGRWRNGEPKCDQARVTSLGFEKIFTTFLIVGLGAVVSVLIFLCEYFVGSLYTKDIADIKKDSKYLMMEHLTLKKLKQFVIRCEQKSNKDFTSKEVLFEVDRIMQCLIELKQLKKNSH